jgi:hypothetical protein
MLLPEAPLESLPLDQVELRLAIQLSSQLQIRMFSTPSIINYTFTIPLPLIHETMTVPETHTFVIPVILF